jgi:hypothetical protein
MQSWSDFINEKFHVNQDVKHLTRLIYDKINLLIPNLINKKEIEIRNLLHKTHSKIKFKNDLIIVKLGKKHGAINEPIYNGGVIEDLTLYLTIDLNKTELISKKMIDNNIKETINHEMQHVIEFYHTKGNLTKSWSFDSRLNTHKSKFQNYNEWMDICHIFYLMEDHELRSRISQSLETLKNNKNSNNLSQIFTQSKVYHDLDILSKIDGKVIIKKMINLYPSDFKTILDDFVKNVLLKPNKNSQQVFINEISRINKKSIESKNKLLRVLYSYQHPESFLEEYQERDIDFTKYM